MSWQGGWLRDSTGPTIGHQSMWQALPIKVAPGDSAGSGGRATKYIGGPAVLAHVRTWQALPIRAEASP